MNQIVDELIPERGEQKLRGYLLAARRRRKPIVSAISAGLLVTVGLALFLPPRYQATGTILIEQQELPSDLVRSTVTSYADQRVQVISQRVMTTQNLLSIIHRYELYKRQQAREPRERLIERMRDDIQFKMISADVVDPRSGAPRKATIAFTVSYTSAVADTAAKIANELTTLYLNENVTERNRLAQDAYSFLQSEGDRLNAQIEQVETKLVEFKSKHYGELPELAQVNQEEFARTEEQLRNAESRRTALEQQLMFLEGQLAQIKPDSAIVSETGERILSPSDRLKQLKAKLASASALYAPDFPDIVRMKQEIAGLEAQLGEKTARVSDTNDIRRSLEKARGELAEAQKRYSPDHPDVQRLERQVAQLEQELVKPSQDSPRSAPADQESGSGQAIAPPSQASAGGRPAAAGAAAASDPATPPDNPAYIQIASQIDAVRTELHAQDGSIAQLRNKTADNQRRLAASPEIEKAYHDLTRDYESAKLKYAEIRSKQMEAQVAENLESDRKGERFTLIEPPLPPEDPVSPNRPLVLILGALASIALAVGIAALLEATDGTVRDHGDLLAAISAPMLAVVPKIMTAADIALGRRRVKYAAGGAAAVAIALLAAVHFFYRPLDVLWFAVVQHFGY